MAQETMAISVDGALGKGYSWGSSLVEHRTGGNPEAICRASLRGCQDKPGHMPFIDLPESLATGADHLGHGLQGAGYSRKTETRPVSGIGVHFLPAKVAN